MRKGNVFFVAAKIQEAFPVIYPQNNSQSLEDKLCYIYAKRSQVQSSWY